MEDLLLILPEDVLLIIFNKLDLYTKLSYIHVCKTLNYIIYDKNVPLAVTAKNSLKKFTTSKSLEEPFKRTISRLYELTSMDFKI